MVDGGTTRLRLIIICEGIFVQDEWGEAEAGKMETVCDEGRYVWWIDLHCRGIVEGRGGSFG